MNLPKLNYELSMNFGGIAMSDILQSVGPDGHTMLTNILLGVLAVAWLGVLVGIIIDSKRKYGTFHKNKQLMYWANREQNPKGSIHLHPSKR